MRVTAFAPATVANVAVGFDILGFALSGAGDRVTVTRTSDPGVTIDGVSGLVPELPRDPARNTASVALLKMIEGLDLTHGFRISIQKGIPVASGMGGSAASAVAAVVGANALLDKPLPKEKLLEFALAGEFVTSGASHPDNAAACLHGGLTLALPSSDGRNAKVISLPVPRDLRCVLVHPKVEVETRSARAVLKREVSLGDHVAQSARLAGFVAGCYSGDAALVRENLSDILIEPQRRHLIPEFVAVQSAAQNAGALGCSISGSGPSVFAWVIGDAAAARAEAAMTGAFRKEGLVCQSWISPLPSPGAHVLEDK